MDREKDRPKEWRRKQKPNHKSGSVNKVGVVEAMGGRDGIDRNVVGEGNRVTAIFLSPHV
jgi:hypothetical protein